MTGVGLAIAALTALLCIIGGLQGFIQSTVAEMGGPGRFMVRSQDASSPAEAFRFSRSVGLRERDGALMQEDLPGSFKVMNMQSNWVVASCAGLVVRANLNGMDKDYLETMMKITIDTGRTFQEQEFLRGDPVTSRNANWRYANAAVIPYRTMQRFHLGLRPSIGGLQMQATKPDSINQLVARITTSLKGIHRGAEDFTFQLFNFIQEFTTMIDNVTLLFGFVAVLSLGTGALGIFNVMLASLADRVREVGVQKALGAKPLEIGVQFLAESVTLSLVGGLVGMLAGTFPLLLGDALEKAFHFRPVLDVTIAFKALGVTVLVGVLAGLFPAWKAMRLNPIEALRYE